MSADAPGAMRCERLARDHVPELRRLFERAGSACFCEWWHFDGDKNEWLARLAHAPERNSERLGERAASSQVEGLVALDDGAEILGFMKLTPAASVPKLYAQRPYRALPCFEGTRASTWTIGCFLVDPERRRRGVAKALLDAGIELARRGGARAIEAFPRRREGLRPEELWTGPFELLARCGFEVIHELAQYPVLRRML